MYFLLKKIKNLRDWKIKISHTRGEENKIPNWLANKAQECQFGTTNLFANGLGPVHLVNKTACQLSDMYRMAGELFLKIK